jgi:hypothetical protein
LDVASVGVNAGYTKIIYGERGGWGKDELGRVGFVFAKGVRGRLTWEIPQIEFMRLIALFGCTHLLPSEIPQFME